MFLPHFLPHLLSKRVFLISKGALDGQCPLQGWCPALPLSKNATRSPLTSTLQTSLYEDQSTRVRRVLIAPNTGLDASSTKGDTWDRGKQIPILIESSDSG